MLDRDARVRQLAAWSSTSTSSTISRPGTDQHPDDSAWTQARQDAASDANAYHEKGFAAPLEGWFRDDLAGVYRDVVLAPDARLRDHLDQEVAAGMLTEHLGGRADLSRRMWLLLAFELWARRWLEVGVRA